MENILIYSSGDDSSSDSESKTGADGNKKDVLIRTLTDPKLAESEHNNDNENKGLQAKQFDCESYETIQSVVEDIKDATTARSDDRPNCFGLFSCISTPDQSSVEHPERLIDTALGAVEVPSGNFWKDFLPDTDMLEKKQEASAAASFQSNKRCSHVMSDEINLSTSFDSHKRQRQLHPKYTEIYSLENDSKAFYSSSAQISVCSDDNSSKDLERKIFYVHSKVTPFLHSKPSCKCSHKLSSSWRAHSAVVNRLNWNIPNYGHLLVSAGMNNEIKVWNVWSTLDPCVAVLSGHRKAVKHVEWSLDGKAVISCSYDRTALVTDVESGKVVTTCEHTGFVTAGCGSPSNQNCFMTGTENNILLWDRRIKEVPVRNLSYKDKFGQVLDIIFSSDQEIVSCSDLVSRDSADRGIMAWDVRSGVVLSNQIYQERYSCTRLKVHPNRQQFLAQSHGEYVALFSTNKPYKMEKRKRFQGHKLEGYSIGFDISTDGSLVYSGSSKGGVHCYDHRSGRLIRKLSSTVGDVITDVACHPILPSLVASCTWGGTINLWS